MPTNTCISTSICGYVLFERVCLKDNIFGAQISSKISFSSTTSKNKKYISYLKTLNPTDVFSHQGKIYIPTRIANI